MYATHLRERFGSDGPLPQNPVWIHAVSLGETRSAVPLVRAFTPKLADRPVVPISSAVIGEDALYIDAINAVRS